MVSKMIGKNALLIGAVVGWLAFGFGDLLNCTIAVKVMFLSFARVLP